MDNNFSRHLDRYLEREQPLQEMTQDEAIELAKAHAATSMEHRDTARDRSWLPPEWVVAAILEAANG